MTFIHPLLLTGLLLVGVPVLIHLIMQQKPKHLLFPAFRFLLQRHRTNQRRLRLRHLLLMALRMLLIVFFCLALARPRLFSERIGVGSERPIAAVLLFDTSASMEYKVGERSRLDEAKRRAQELLDDLPDGSRVAVLDSGEMSGEWLATLSLARERVAGLKLRPNSGPVSRQIGQAYRLFEELEQGEEPGAEPLPRFVYVFSDRTQASWDSNDVKNLKQPEQVRAAFVDVGVKEPQDVALGNPELPEPIVAPGEYVEVRVPVRATGTPCDTVISCQIDEEAEEKKPLKLQAGQSEVVVFRRPVSNLSAGPHQVRVRLASSDALPFNNDCFAAFEVRAGRSILVLADQVGDAAIWKLALEAKGFRCVVMPMDDAHNLTPAYLLANYPAVCLLSVAEPNVGLNRDIWDKLHDYVQRGGGLGILPGGEELSKDAYNSDAASKLLPAELVGMVTAPKEPGPTWNEGESKHPLMAPFKEWRKSADVDFHREDRRPAARKYWEVRPYGGDADVVVRYADESRRPALVERKLGQGRVLLFTVPLDRRQPPWHNYWNESSFGLVLADKAVGYLAGDADRANFNYLSGQPVTVQLPAAPYFPTYTLLGPGLTGAETSLRRPEEQNSVQITQAVTPGQYAVFDAKGTPVARFSINVRAEESQLDDRVPVEPIEALLGPGSVVTIDQGTNLRDALQGRWLQPLELFPWLMIGLLLALAIENLLANRFYRQPAQQPEEQRAA